jgi:5-methylthioadenosine/S-adenosylhomocysteine deaminase
MRPMHDIMQNLVYNTCAANIETVIVDGRIIVQDGNVLTVDEEEVVTKAQRVAERIWSNIKFPDNIR